MRQFLFNNINRFTPLAFAVTIFVVTIGLGMLFGHPAGNLRLDLLALSIALIAATCYSESGIGIEEKLRLTLLKEDDLIIFADGISDNVMVGLYLGRPETIKFQLEDVTFETRPPTPSGNLLIVEVQYEGEEEIKILLIDSWQVLEIGMTD